MTVPKLYRAATVCEATGVKAVTLRQWHNRGTFLPETDDFAELFELANDEAVKRALSLRPDIAPEVVQAVRNVQNAQRGGWRYYTRADILRVAIIVRLIRHGVEAGRAGLIAKHCHVGGLPNPQIVHITADGREPSLVRPIPEGKDQFAVVFEVNGGYEEDTGIANAESWWVERSLFHFYGIENLPNLNCIRQDIVDGIHPHFDAETFLVLNLSAIDRQVQAKL